MSLNKYEVLRAVVESGTLSKAAESIGLSQSAISHALANLESEFGFELLTRGRSGIKLTHNGEKVLIYINEILNLNEKLIQEVNKINGLEKGIVRLGTFPSVAIQWLPEIMKRFEVDYPNIELKLYEGDYDEIEKWIEDRTVDLGFLPLPIQRKDEVISLKQDRLLCILSDEHPLAEQEMIYFNQLEDEWFIMPKSTIDKDVRRVLKKHQIKPKIRYEIAEDFAIISMVQKNLGISILPELILYSLPENIRVIPLEGNYYRTIGIVAPSLKGLSPGAKKMIDLIKEIINL
ncbi:LysR family transcriptional regulator [Pseudogracilibacillus sp. SE30717A]|uniref:LysR family transcriptional regulator n=1 Tax=Pseudogracilibacillus sp. SE30717A TaxID=3098293 RepID=UPI00300E3E3D